MKKVTRDELKFHLFIENITLCERLHVPRWKAVAGQRIEAVNLFSDDFFFRSQAAFEDSGDIEVLRVI